MSRRRTSLVRDTRGATLTEFGLIAPVMIVTLLGFFEFGHQMYASAILRGAVEEAGRNSTLVDGPAKAAAIDAAVRARVQRVVPQAADEDFTITRYSYSDFTTVGKPEKYTDSNDNDAWDAGECLEDVNGNGTWDRDPGKVGSGGAQDVTYYRVEVTYRRMFPIAGLIGISDDANLKTFTTLKNQPFAAHNKPVISTCT